MQTHPLLLLLGIAGTLLFGSIDGQTQDSWRNGQNASAVWGQPNFTTSKSGSSKHHLNVPDSIAADPTTGKVFISDAGNHRVLRFASFAALETGASAEAVFGQGDFRTVVPAGTRSRLDNPKGISIDAQGRLWVADANNHRVLRFDNASAKVNGANADGVLGQPDFTTNDIAGGAAGMGYVAAVFADASGRVWVSDWDNKRVTRFDNAAAKPNGAAADAVLGQPDFDTINEATDQMSLRSPAGLAMDGSGNLWVADIYQARVVMFRNAAGKPDGANADLVLGQLEFTTANPNQTSWGLGQPSGLAIDGKGTLWVTDQMFHRVLRYESPALSGHGASAAHVLGQPGFESAGWGTNRKRFNVPEGVCIGGEGAVWVADRENHRLLKFEKRSAYRPDGLIGLTRNAMLGDDFYSNRGDGQEINLTIAKKRARRFHFAAENDGNAADDFRIRGSRTNRKIAVKYFRLTGGRENVTGKISRAGYEIPKLNPGQAIRFKGKVAAASTRASSRRATKLMKLLVFSDSDVSRDRMNVIVKCRP